MNNQILVSNCCGAADVHSQDGPSASDIQRCPECLEGCDFITEDEMEALESPLNY